MTDGLAAVLFDMDGLLVDTEPLWLETETEVMARLGAPWTARDQQALLGGSMQRTVSYLLARASRPAPPRTVERWLTEEEPADVYVLFRKFFRPGPTADKKEGARGGTLGSPTS